MGMVLGGNAAYRILMTRDQRFYVLLACLPAIGLASDTARATENISTYLSSNTKDGETSADIGFGDESCGGECHIATLFCSASGSITVLLADIDATDAASAITRETGQIVLTAGGKSFEYFIQDMQYAEMTGAWWLTARTQDVHARELAPTIAKAKTIEAMVGQNKVVLPVDANVRTWAVACR